jgi:Lipase maturation factor
MDWTRGAREEPGYWLTRFLVLRLLGLVYFVAFLCLVEQLLPLLGARGLLPIPLFLRHVSERAGSPGAGFLRVPSLFWLDASDGFLQAAAWAGVVLSIPVVLGFANGLLMAVLWALYMSFVHVGQDWYGFGWEIQLLETGFLAIFLCPPLDAHPFPRRPPPPEIIWLLRWLTFRIMLGAGLIKLRGDPCWRRLTCLYYHYETQPIPNPLSRTLHFMPRWFHRAGVLFNHLTELVAPWFVFWPRRARLGAGVVMVAFQLFLIFSGNLSFLNWLTLVPILACFDDAFLSRFLPRALVRASARAADTAVPVRAQRLVAGAVVALVALLSIAPVRNLLSGRQVMNTSFDRLDLVNTYGAFGSVGRERDEIVLEGTDDAVPGDDADWRPYEFRCKPGDPMRRPCVISPYHYRLDWLMWFAAMSRPEQYPWSLHLVWKLLHGDPGVLGLLVNDPFPGAPPRFIRATLYRYRFARSDDPGGAWWTRERIGTWLPPLSTEDLRLRRFLRSYDWLDDSG